MKLLFTPLIALTLLAGCSPSTPALTPQQAAVTAYLQKTLDDPASYQPARWGKPEQLTVGILNRSKRTLARLRYGIDSIRVHSDSTLRIKSLEFDKRITYSGSEIYKRRAARIYDSLHAIHLRSRDSARIALKNIGPVSDTTPAGYLITHVFRAKNKMGALVLDSARYEVTTDGKVSVWDGFKN